MWDIDFNRLRDVFVYDPQAPMIFSSGIFLWLFATFILVYLLLQRRLTARLLFVTAFSYYFIIKVAELTFPAGTCYGYRFLYCPSYGILLCALAAQGVGVSESCYQSWPALLFQIYQFPGRCLRFAGRWYVPPLRYIPPCGYFFLYFPVT